MGVCASHLIPPLTFWNGKGFLWQHGEDGFEIAGFDQQMVSIRFRPDVMFEITLTDTGTKRAKPSCATVC